MWKEGKAVIQVYGVLPATKRSFSDWWKLYSKPGLHIIRPIEYIAIGKKRVSSCTMHHKPSKIIAELLGRIGLYRARDQRCVVMMY